MEPVVTTSFLSRPENRWARALFMAVVLTAAWGTARLVPSAVVVVAVGVAGLIVVSVLVLNQALASGSHGYLLFVVATVLVSLFIIMAAFNATGERYMRAEGTRHFVTVAAERLVQPQHKVSYWYCTLHEGGVVLPGELVTITHDFRPGQVIEVYSRGEEHKAVDTLDRSHMDLASNVGYLISVPLMLATGYFAPTRRTRGRGSRSGQR